MVKPDDSKKPEKRFKPKPFKPPPPTSYERKFAELLRLLDETKEETILIHNPQVLGDDYEEIVESLNRIADAERELVILPRKKR